MRGDDLATAVVIDDDPVIRELLTQVFEAAGFSASSVETGDDGVRAILQSTPLVATIDLSMPGVDGIETVRRVRAAGSTTHLIMVTGSNEESDVVLSLSAGADEYLVKPVRMREMRARLDAVLRRARAARDAAQPVEPSPLPPAPWITSPSQGAAPAAPPTSWPQQAPAAQVPHNPWPSQAPAAVIPQNPWPQQAPAAQVPHNPWPHHAPAASAPPPAEPRHIAPQVAEQPPTKQYVFTPQQPGRSYPATDGRRPTLS